MANPSGNGTNNNDAAHPSHHGGTSVPDPNPNPNPSVCTDWTPDEQSILEDGLAQYASESNIIRYAKIAVQLQNKTVRDVALRCRWMFKRDISKRRKEDYILTRKSKDRKFDIPAAIQDKMNDNLASTSHLPIQTGTSSSLQRVVANGNSNSIQHSAILPTVLVSPPGQLIKKSAQALERVSANLETLEAHQVHENMSLLCQVRKNILDILTNLSDTPEKLKQMPPLPVKLNDDLFNSLLPRVTLLQQMQ